MVILTDHCPPERMKFNILEGVHHCDPVDPTQCFPPENILRQRPYCDNDNPNQGEGLWIGPEVRKTSEQYCCLDLQLDLIMCICRTIRQLTSFWIRGVNSQQVALRLEMDAMVIP